MSPGVQTRGPKVSAPDNIYTVILALAFGIVLATIDVILIQEKTNLSTVNWLRNTK